MAAKKEAIAIVLDVSATMNKPFRGGRKGRRRLHAAVDSIKRLIEQKLLYSKGTEIGIVSFGSDTTNNPINDRQGGYEHVDVIAYMEEPTPDLLSTLESRVKPSTTAKGDWIDGLIVGFDMIYNKIGTKKYTKRIFVVTDGENEVKEADQLQEIIEQLNSSDTSVNIIAIDFCSSLEDSDSESGDPKEEHKSDGDDDDDENDNKPKGGKAGVILVEKLIKSELEELEEQLGDNTETQEQRDNQAILENFTSKIKGAIFPAKIAISIFKQFQK